MSEKEMTLGEFLRNEREIRGITIEQVASATKVGIRTLHALEADHYAELPAKPYIRGFVTSYCRFIGIDPKEIRARFDDYISKKTTERPNRDGGHSGYVFEKKDGEQQSRTVLLIAICGFVLLGAVAVIFFKPSLRHHRTSHLDRLRAAQQTTPEDNKKVLLLVGASPTSSPLPYPSPEVSILPKVPETIASESSTDASEALTEESDEKAPGDETSSSEIAGKNPKDPLDSGLALSSEEIHHKILVKVLVDVWLKFQVDQRPIRKFIVRKGKVLVLRAKDKIVFQVSNSKSVKCVYNGKESDLGEQSKNAVLTRGVKTYFFPFGEHEASENSFANDKALPKTLDPETDTNNQIKGQ